MTVWQHVKSSQASGDLGQEMCENKERWKTKTEAFAQVGYVAYVSILHCIGLRG